MIAPHVKLMEKVKITKTVVLKNNYGDDSYALTMIYVES